MRATSRLRELLGTGKTLLVPGCYNALSAKILETVGFPAVYMTGYGTSLSLLGLPDAGLATMTEMHLNARYIANAVSVPVIAMPTTATATPSGSSAPCGSTSRRGWRASTSRTRPFPSDAVTWRGVA